MAAEAHKKSFSWKEYHSASVLVTLFNLFFLLLPFWLALIFSLHNWQGWNKFYKTGEFFIYGTGLLSSAYFVFNNNKISRADFSAFFSLFCLIFMFVLSAIYTAISVYPNFGSSNISKYGSAIIMIVALIVYYYSQVIYHKKSPDVSTMRNEEQKRIMDAL